LGAQSSPLGWSNEIDIRPFQEGRVVVLRGSCDWYAEMVQLHNENGSK
jgi:hypothetical protein